MTTLTRPTTRLRRQQAMELLARGLPPTDVALQLGVSLRTVRRYLEDGELLAELRRAQSERIEALLRAGLQIAPQALLTLHQVASDPDAPHRARVAAARTVIQQTVHLYDVADLVRRIERLEEIAEAVEKDERAARWG
jgi:FixJ family two-component response regulator